MADPEPALTLEGTVGNRMYEDGRHALTLDINTDDDTEDGIWMHLISWRENDVNHPDVMHQLEGKRVTVKIFINEEEQA